MKRKAFLLASVLLAATAAASFAGGFDLGLNIGTNSGIAFKWGTDTDVFLNIGFDLPRLNTNAVCGAHEGYFGTAEVGMDFPVVHFTENMPLTIGWMLPVHVGAAHPDIMHAGDDTDQGFALGVDVLATIGLQYKMPSAPLDLYIRLGAGIGSDFIPNFSWDNHPFHFAYSGAIGLMYRF